MSTTGSVQILAWPRAAAGFRLTGLPVTEVSTHEAASAAYAAISSDGNTRILLVQEELAADLPAAGIQPLVIPIPRAAWQTPEATAEAYIAELMRAAIGYHVRLR